MSETPSFQPKPPELLRQQVEKAAQKVGEELIPPFGKEDVFSMPISEITTKKIIQVGHQRHIEYIILNGKARMCFLGEEKKNF